MLTREPLQPGRPSGPEMRRWLNLLSLAVVVLALAFAGLQAWRARPIPPAATPTPTIRPLPTPLTPAPILPADLGWVPAGPTWAQQIAFAPSAPSRGYVCGAPSPSFANQQGQIALGVSDDSGASWHALATPANGIACQLTVNPANPRDVVIEAYPCINCVRLPPAALIRSRDGGRSWSRVSFPPRADQSREPFIDYVWAWTGANLFIAPHTQPSARNRLLAVSVDGAPFTWVLAPSLLASVPPDSQIAILYGTESAVYADLARTEPCVSGECDTVMVSLDQGATWAPFTPESDGKAVRLISTLLDGRTLVGTLSQGQDANSAPRYVRSADGGATWTPLGPFPGNLVPLSLISAPNGALYAELWSFGVPTATPGIYMLSPVSPGWKLVAALPASGQPPVLSWDTQGRPLALWSLEESATEQGPTHGLVKFAL